MRSLIDVGGYAFQLDHVTAVGHIYGDAHQRRYEVWFLDGIKREIRTEVMARTTFIRLVNGGTL